MNYPDQPQTNTVEDSLHIGHRAADRAADLLDAIWGDLTGEAQVEPGNALPACGLVWSADNLATRMNTIADRLELVRGRIVSPKVVSMPQSTPYRETASPSRY